MSWSKQDDEHKSRSHLSDWSSQYPMGQDCLELMLQYLSYSYKNRQEWAASGQWRWHSLSRITTQTRTWNIRSTQRELMPCVYVITHDIVYNILYNVYCYCIVYTILLLTHPSVLSCSQWDDRWLDECTQQIQRQTYCNKRYKHTWVYTENIIINLLQECLA